MSESDPLASARGLFFGLLLGTALWFIIGWIVWMVAR